jgi:hypothetical protein
MHGAAMRNLQEPFFLLCGDTVGKMDAYVDAADAVGSFGHRPFCLDRQALLRDAVPPTELPNKICDTTREGPDKEFNRSHAGILSSILRGLVGDDAMLTAHNVVTHPAVKRCREFHVVLPAYGRFLPLTNAALLNINTAHPLASHPSANHEFCRENPVSSVR